MEKRASQSSVVKSVNGLFQEDACIIHQYIDGSKVAYCRFDCLGSRFVLADFAIEQNQAAGTRQLLIGFARRRERKIEA